MSESTRRQTGTGPEPRTDSDVETGPEPAAAGRSQRPGPDIETSGAHTDETGAEPDTEPGTASNATGSNEPASNEPGSNEPEDHLHPEPLAMTGEDVIHALDPEHWLPENRRDQEGSGDEAGQDDRKRSKYPYIRADFPAPFG